METAISLRLKKSNSFLERFEEGFTIPDLRYISWLKLNHPEADFTVFSMEPSLQDYFP